LSSRNHKIHIETSDDLKRAKITMDDLERTSVLGKDFVLYFRDDQINAAFGLRTTNSLGE